MTTRTIKPDQLREALSYTASVTAFSPRLIEKDYYCSLVLAELSELFQSGITFKGGTALSKIHAAFYRLSEDLDFAISTPLDATRRHRREAIAPVREFLTSLCARCDWLTPQEALTGKNESTHYIGALSYLSCLSSDRETIRIEFSLREPLLDQTMEAEARTILLNPLTQSAAMVGVPVRCITLREAYAEKIRAALTRREPAIRDLYDLSYAMRAGLLDFDDSELIAMAATKLKVPGNGNPDLAEGRIMALQKQVETELRPVLKDADFAQFDFHRAVELLRRFAEALP